LVSSRRSSRPSIPVYEEAGTNGFSAKLGEVEVAIYQSLHHLGVSESQVQFRRVVRRAQEEKHWDYVELEVSLPPGKSLTKAQQVVTGNLGALPGEISWEAKKKDAAHLELLIKVEGILTHRLALYLTKEEQPRRSPAAAEIPRVAIVIDDLGHDGRLAQRFLEIKAPLSFSVLPHGTFSKSIALRIHEAGRELLLHLPMEPKGYPETNPGDGALLVEMPDATLLQKLREDLDSVPYVVGVNNHMGSRLCEYAEKMSLVMVELKERGLFFLDSRTSSMSKAYGVAVQMGVPAVERDVFLDNIQDPPAIRSQIRRLIQLARLKGRAIGIAHPHDATLEVLRETMPQFQVQGIELVPVSQLLQYSVAPQSVQKTQR
jgi:polysaccharide deacetylase 2 family uncharacterized protein YibQ